MKEKKKTCVWQYIKKALFYLKSILLQSATFNMFGHVKSKYSHFLTLRYRVSQTKVAYNIQRLKGHQTF